MVPVSVKEWNYLIFSMGPFSSENWLDPAHSAVQHPPESMQLFTSSGSGSWPHSNVEWVAAVGCVVVFIMEEIRESILKDMLSEVFREQISSLQFVTSQNFPAGKCCYLVQNFSF